MHIQKTFSVDARVAYFLIVFIQFPGEITITLALLS